MKKIQVTSSYNMDILSFINVMSSDEFYVNYYQKEYNVFYPLLSDIVKSGINALTSSAGRANIAPLFTTIISSLDNNNNREIKEMICKYNEIDMKMKTSPYYSLYEPYLKMLPNISALIIQLIDELEANGYKEYWQNEKLPLIENRCKEIDNLIAEYDTFEYISKYKKLSDDEIIIYISAFANPHATRLYGNAILIDYIFSDNFIMNTVIHELFHPPYKYEEVSDLIEKLASKNFVINAHKNQNPLFAYDDMNLFIEENIVEALAVHAVVSLGLEDQPYEYFKKHDEGSHVISPHFYTYLNENDIKGGQTFNEYLKTFVEYLSDKI